MQLTFGYENQFIIKKFSLKRFCGYNYRMFLIEKDENAVLNIKPK